MKCFEINQSINQIINQSINQSINQTISQPINQSTNQSINQSIIPPWSMMYVCFQRPCSPAVPGCWSPARRAEACRPSPPSAGPWGAPDVAQGASRPACPLLPCPVAPRGRGQTLLLHPTINFIIHQCEWVIINIYLARYHRSYSTSCKCE